MHGFSTKSVQTDAGSNYSKLLHLWLIKDLPPPLDKQVIIATGGMQSIRSPQFQTCILLQLIVVFLVHTCKLSSVALVTVRQDWVWHDVF